MMDIRGRAKTIASHSVYLRSICARKNKFRVPTSLTHFGIFEIGIPESVGAQIGIQPKARSFPEAVSGGPEEPQAHTNPTCGQARAAAVVRVQIRACRSATRCCRILRGRPCPRCRPGSNDCRSRWPALLTNRVAMHVVPARPAGLSCNLCKTCHDAQVQPLGNSQRAVRPSAPSGKRDHDHPWLVDKETADRQRLLSSTRKRSTASAKHSARVRELGSSCAAIGQSSAGTTRENSKRLTKSEVTRCKSLERCAIGSDDISIERVCGCD